MRKEEYERMFLKVLGVAFALLALIAYIIIFGIKLAKDA